MGNVSVYRKEAKKVKINGQDLNIQPLGMNVILSLQQLKKPIAKAIAKFKSIGINAFKETVNSIPKPTEQDPDNMVLTTQTTHSAPSPELVDKAIDNRGDAIEALFDCLFQEDLLGKIFSSSVLEFKSLTHADLFSDDGDNCLDLPTAIEILGHIIEVNIGGFESLGKSCHPLKKFLEQVGVKL